MKNIVQAVQKVMEECQGIDKSMTVGRGNSSYKGVSDKDVKLKIGKAMRDNGLIIVPMKIEPTTTINSYETTDYNGKPTVKQTVFTEVLTTYQLIHESGEKIELQGYGHGTDPQDKAAGKATTYAMKYALLYTFMVATGHIDDTDATHSNDISTPPVQKKSEPKVAINKGKERLSPAHLKHCIANWDSKKDKTTEFLASRCFTPDEWKQITKTDWAGGETFNG